MKHTLSFHYITHSKICQAIAVFLAIFGIVLTTIATHVSASTQDFYFKNAEFDYYLEETDTGTKMHVKEELTAVFPYTDQNHGITRVIPTTNQNGANPTVSSYNALNLTVTRNGQTENISKTERDSDSITVYIGNASTYVHGEQVYVLEYDFENVVTEFTSANVLTYNDENASFQELYWDTNGTGWSQSFDSLTARLHLSSSAAKNLRSGTSCYVGRYGTSGSSRCNISSDDETTFSGGNGEYILTFETSNLSAGENLTFAVDFNPNTFTVPEPKKSYTFFVIFCIHTAILIALFLLAYSAYKKSALPRKRFYKDLFVAPQYAPEKNLTIADSAKVYMNTTSKSQVATLIELAVSGKVELIKVSEEEKGIFKKKNGWTVKVKSLENITEPQKIVLEILNGGGTVSEGDTIVIEYHSATTTMTSLARSYDSKTESRLKSFGMFEEKIKSPVGPFVGIALVYTFISFIAFTFFISDATVKFAFGSVGIVILTYLLSFTSLVANIVLDVSGHKYMTRTEKGLVASNYIEGLKLYIDMAEEDRIQFLQSVDGADTSTKGVVKLYEKLLPYAIIFGLEDSWMKELNRYYEMDDSIEHGWYSGTDLLTYSMFSSMVTSTSNTISSSTSSSSDSSGGGGGGFSGGGGGGGGGGGW